MSTLDYPFAQVRVLFKDTIEKYNDTSFRCGDVDCPLRNYLESDVTVLEAKCASLVDHSMHEASAVTSETCEAAWTAYTDSINQRFVEALVPWKPLLLRDRMNSVDFASL